MVISDRKDAGAVQRAERAGIPHLVVPWTGDKETFTAAICRAALHHEVEALILAGFMRILGAQAISLYPERIVNIHPALLPAFPGPDAVEQALMGGVKITGVTVHFVDEMVDHGPIIAQEAIEIYPDDDTASLHARLQKIEHVLYPEVVVALSEGRLSVDGRKVKWT